MTKRIATLQQQLTRVQSVFVNNINNVQAIKSSVPDCLFIALEQQANTKYNIPNFARVFGEHSFYFIPKKLENLDIHFGRYEQQDYYRVEHGYITGFIANKLQFLYGLNIKVTSYPEVTILADDLINAFNHKKSVICEYSAGFIPERLEDYQKHYGYHIVIFQGYNPDTQNFIIDEVQKCGMTVSLEDFIQSFDDVLQHEGEVNVYTLEKNEPGKQHLSIELVKEEIKRNIDGIYSKEPWIGLNCIDKFMHHISYLPEACGPYIVPGVWVFSLQRRACVDWLSALQQDFPQFNIGETCQKMQQGLLVLAKKWKELEYLMSLSVKSSKITGNTIYQRFETLFVLEKKIVPLWRELQTAFIGHSEVLH